MFQFAFASSAYFHLYPLPTRGSKGQRHVLRSLAGKRCCALLCGKRSAAVRHFVQSVLCLCCPVSVFHVE